MQTETTEETKKASITVYRLSFWINGIKVKCRKEERHYFAGLDYPLDFNIEEIHKEIRACATLRMKKITDMKISYILNYTTIDFERGFKTMKFEPFSNRNIRGSYNLSIKEVSE